MESFLSKSFESQSSVDFSTNRSIAQPLLEDFQITGNLISNQVIKRKISRAQLESQYHNGFGKYENLVHPNLLRFLGSKPLGEWGCSILFENFSTTLDQEIVSRSKQNDYYSEAEIVQIMQDIGSVLAYLQTNKVPYGQIGSSTIVKVGLKYKLQNLLLLENQNAMDQKSSLASGLQSSFLNSVHENYKDDVNDFGSTVLDAMTLCTDVTVPTSQKISLASSRYSKPLMILINKMLEQIASLRFDCITCNYFIQILAQRCSRSPSESFNFSHRRRASSANSRQMIADKDYKQNSSRIPCHPDSVKNMPAINYSNLKGNQSQSHIDQRLSNFEEILKDALPNEKNRDTFFSNLPQNLSDMADSLIAKTFAVKSQRAFKARHGSKTSRGIQTDIKNNENSNNSSFFSMNDTRRKENRENLRINNFPNKQAANDVLMPLDMKIKDFNNIHQRDERDLTKKRTRTRPKPLQLEDDDLESMGINESLQIQKEITPKSERNVLDERSSFNKHVKADRDMKYEFSILDRTWKDYSTDYLTNTSSGQDRRSPHYALLTSRSRQTESPNLIDNEYLSTKTNQKDLMINGSNVKIDAQNNRHRNKLRNKNLLNDEMRLPSFGDDQDQIEVTEEYQYLNLSVYGNKQAVQTPRSEINDSKKERSTYKANSSFKKSPSQTPKRYITEVHPEGSVYQGEAVGNMRHGVGRMTFLDGSCYEGEWNQDRMEGFGVLFYPNGTIAYEGEWQKNKCNGKGVLYNEQLSLQGNSSTYNFLKKEEGWIRYEGGFCNDKWEGEGKLVFVNGDDFFGDFVNDLIHGLGKLTTSSGIVYEGEWANNSLIRLFKKSSIGGST